MQTTERKGAQEPRVRYIDGDVAYTDGDDACSLAADLGTHLFPWQQQVLRDWLSRTEADDLSFLTAGLSVPRQNGKNAAIECLELYALAVLNWHILHTAHLVKTAKKSFMRLVHYFTDDKHPEVKALVAKIRYTNGEEAIYLKGGGSIEFSARTRGASRGFDNIQLVVFDEAQELTDEQLNAIMPTLAASSSGERVMLYTGTPPDIDGHGEVFRRVRQAALTGKSKRTTWSEWGVVELPKAGATFEELLPEIYRSNPSMGYVLDEDWTANEFSTASLDGFARERLGWWEAVAESAAATPYVHWAACGVEKNGVPKRGKKAFAVKFDPSGQKWALAAARLPEEGLPYVELINVGDMQAGLGALKEFLLDEQLIETTAAVAVDGRAGMAPLTDALKEAYPKQALMVPGARGVVDACSMLDTAVREHQILHLASKGQALLDDAVRTSIKRTIGTDGGWAYDGEYHIPVEAAALAFWAVKTTRRDPDGDGVIF